MTAKRSERDPGVSLRIRVATYNINGMSGKSKHIMDFFYALDIDVIGLTETWQRPQDSFVLPLQYETLIIPLVGQQWRGHKVVDLALRHIVNCKREATSVTTNTMYVTVRVKDLYLTVLYAAPKHRAGSSRRRLTKYIGDLEDRRLVWRI